MKITEQLHRELVDQLQHFQRLDDPKHDWVNSYLGTPHKRYGISSKSRDIIVRQFLKKHPDLSVVEWFDLLDQLYAGESFEERTFPGQFLIKSKELRTSLNLEQFNKWLGELVGWAEIDSNCQSTFQEEEVLARWFEWDKFLDKLSKDKNISRRRASLVLLVKPTRQSDDPRLAKRAFANIDRLRGEKDILITKAVSWLLRSMITSYRQQVSSYIEHNRQQIPAIAYRETKRKLETGRK